VGTGQRIVSIDRVIEGHCGPVCCVVASGACGGETGRHVIGIRAAREILLMAAVAGRWKSSEIVIGVALQTWNSGMRASKRENRMIEGRRAPAAGSVAHGAIRGEAARHMVGVRGSVKIRLVAGVASGGRGNVAIIHMALRAWHRCVLAGQGIMGIQCVIERSIEPIDG